MNSQAFWFSPGFWDSVYAVLNWIFIVLDAALLFAFLYALKEAIPFRRVLRIGNIKDAAAPAQATVFRERWEAVVRRFDQHSPEARRLAVLEADMLAESVLKEFGMEGETMADRLTKITPEALTSLNQLWKAHRLRNELAQSSERELTPEDAREAIEGYETFLKEVKIL